MRSWNHRVIKGQWRHMARNSFFEFLTPKNYPRAFKNHRNVFYSSQGTCWTLKFCSSSTRSKVIGDHGFSSISALDLTSEVTGWPRTLSLCINLFVSRRATRLFFPRSSSSIRGETARGDHTNPPPPCAVEGCEMACAGEGWLRLREVKIRSRVKVRRFLGFEPWWPVTGNIDPQYLNYGKMFSYAWLRYAMVINRILRKGRSQCQVSKGHYM